MMNYADLLTLRARLVAAQANRHTIGAAEAYVRALEAEVSLVDYNSRRETVKHLLALVDAALEARKKLPTKIKRQRDFSHPTATVESPPLRGRTEVVEHIDDAAFTPPVQEVKKASKGRRVAHGRARPSHDSSAETTAQEPQAARPTSQRAEPKG